MDKSDSRLHCEQIEKFMKAGRYDDAVYLADKVDWRKETETKRLIQAAECYRRTRRYDDAVNILKMAHNKKPNNKKIVYLLCETYFECKDVVTAQVYLDRYQSMTDRDDWHFDALKYKRALAYDLPVAEKIDILVELKNKEPAAEQFRYELAKLYNQARQYAECAAECDELLLLFGDDGTYAKKALNLKKGCVGLSEDQEKLLRKLSLGDSGNAGFEGSKNIDIMNTVDMGVLGLQNDLAKDIQNLKHEEVNEAPRKRAQFHTKSLEQTVPPSTQEIFFSDSTADINFTQVEKAQSSKRGNIREVTMPETSANEIIYDASMDDDFDDEKEVKRTTMNDLLSDWSKVKERNTANLRKSIHEDVVEQTGKIFEKKKLEGDPYEDEEEEPGSIWKEVDLQDEFDEQLVTYEEEPVAEQVEEAVEEEAVETDNSFEAEAPVSMNVIEPQTEEENIEEGATKVIPDLSEALAEAEVKKEESIGDILEEDLKAIAEPQAEENVQDEANNDIIEEASEEVVEEAPKKRVEKAEEVNSNEGVKDLSPEERKLFSQFLHPRSMRTQIANALENISLASYVGNVLITTDNEETGFALAKSIVKFVKFADINFSGAMSRIKAEDFNTKNVIQILDKLNNGALVIEEANKLSNASLIKLTQGINQEDRGILIFLIDTRGEIKKLVNRQRTLTDFFNIKIDVIAMSESALVDYGMKYANNLGYSVDEGFANMALHKRVREAQAGNHTVTIGEVKSIVDEAIERNSKHGISYMFRKASKNYKDENGMILLREKDFD